MRPIYMPDHEPVNADALRKLRSLGGEKFLLEMIALFRDYGAKKVAEARKALAEHNALGMEKASHAIKSSAMNLGANRLRELCANMEQSAKQNQWESLPVLQAELESEFERVRIALEPAAKNLEV